MFGKWHQSISQNLEGFYLPDELLIISDQGIPNIHIYLFAGCSLLYILFILWCLEGELFQMFKNEDDIRSSFLDLSFYYFLNYGYFRKNSILKNYRKVILHFNYMEVPNIYLRR